MLPGRGVEILDQTLLPLVERRVLLSGIDSVCEAIRELRVRGAPLLGLVGAAGMAIAADTTTANDADLAHAARLLDATRPTATDLGRAVRDALAQALSTGPSAPLRREALWRNAERLLALRRAEDEAIGQFGAELLPRGASVLTHCNTGALATAGIGTALGVVSIAHRQGRIERCYATETRPLLQGARLTTWELTRLGIPATLLPDTAAAALIASGLVDAVITGADRIAANGDTANKVGTYGLAAVAARHAVPFYIAAPTSTFDPGCPSGAEIPIEFRSPAEVGGFAGTRWSPDGIEAYNPAFDVTPASCITAIVTQHGVLRPPFAPAIAGLPALR
ncbi:S-methyl-5-thioribose-1-phosphate isomerase [bacterium]|nr:MAG: S-methyl-5-thioribose-1-phosphate isomerase [bacterium]MCL4231530.1 S-methyl-5-thioribose-1-phosphate isomerase [Dehalococcoidia bacterium]